MLELKWILLLSIELFALIVPIFFIGLKATCIGLAYVSRMILAIVELVHFRGELTLFLWTIIFFGLLGMIAAKKEIKKQIPQ